MNNIDHIRLHRSDSRLEIAFQGEPAVRLSAQQLYILTQPSMLLSHSGRDNVADLKITAFAPDQQEGLTLAFNNGLIAVIDWQLLYQLSVTARQAEK
ncbi:hypothetical protein [Piscirickettsia salmonis]|uniref:Uncharacterized protein n=2 Tax=Piscirickettsia salmonis TaxID=1238 RepID=A0A9Q6LV36_PISSA|nr:hypothetical protein [Piscirickettsia salmonis]ALA23846.1 1-(5-phosphoribosyl)-5-[(5-phosphoribosylamino)methylideneamino] imidazole-4-carboxamide isomerase [Piscirickettsia salmonis]QGN78625.1 hypothetical protein Psal001_02868 [Piscirickettsia salmonis]QGN82208.1 hypothetical protein Psal002_02886 [Piscirickettsia salmonis]QGN83521.1 hypothetical protein Psal003_00547 [Piscirickettsia salmonis]QGN87034.1 hypothetical protein Psal004_00546 [Piscirickettsia salmonis]